MESLPPRSGRPTDPALRPGHNRHSREASWHVFASPRRRHGFYRRNRHRCKLPLRLIRQICFGRLGRLPVHQGASAQQKRGNTCPQPSMSMLHISTLPEVGVQVIQDAMTVLIPHLVFPVPLYTYIVDLVDNAQSAQKNPYLTKEQFRSRGQRVNLGMRDGGIVAWLACLSSSQRQCDNASHSHR